VELFEASRQLLCAKQRKKCAEGKNLCAIETHLCAETPKSCAVLELFCAEGILGRVGYGSFGFVENTSLI